MKKYTLLVLVFATFISCEGDTQDPNAGLATYHKSVGFCGETWGQEFLDYEQGEAIDAASDLLKEQEIAFTSLVIDSIDQGAICATCHDCPSGWYYVLIADVVHEDELLDLDFEKK